MIKWDECTWPNIEGADKNALVILPVGATEQHGERMPLATDHLLATYMAEAVARVFPGSLVLPTLVYGMSRHHTAFPGTISLETETYVRVMYDILVSILRAGFRRILIVNGHGGNHAQIEEAHVFIRGAFPDARIANPVVPAATSEKYAQAARDLGFTENVVHAGAIECSMIAHIVPHLVADAQTVTQVATGASWGQGAESPERWKELFPMGQKGDQRDCRPDAGGILLGAFIAELANAATQLLQ